MAPIIAFLNMRVKPFDDVRARRAVGGYGLDRAEIAQRGVPRAHQAAGERAAAQACQTPLT